MREPQQKDAFTKRWRRVKAPEPSEYSIHKSIVDYLELMLRPDVQCWHCANGEARDRWTGVKLKSMRLVPGAPDLHFRWRARWSLDCLTECLDMEIKAPNGKQSAAQKQWQEAAQLTGVHYHVVRSLKDAIDVLERYGMVRPRQAKGRG